MHFGGNHERYSNDFLINIFQNSGHKIMIVRFVLFLFTIRKPRPLWRKYGIQNPTLSQIFQPTLIVDLLHRSRVKFLHIFVALSNGWYWRDLNGGGWGIFAQFSDVYRPKHTLHYPRTVCHIWFHNVYWEIDGELLEKTWLVLISVHEPCWSGSSYLSWLLHKWYYWVGSFWGKITKTSLIRKMIECT